MIKYLSILLIILPSASIAFEKNGWVGEGIPVMSFKANSAIFCNTPKTDASCKEKPVVKNVKIAFDNYKYIKSSKVITTKEVTMEAVNDFIIRDYNLKIKKGTKLIKYQYSAEGYYKVGIADKVYEIDLHSYKQYLTNYKQEPQTESWVNVVNKGWLKMTGNNNVSFHQRKF